METTLIYLLLFILLFQLFILVVLSFKPTNTCCKKDCCCDNGKECCKEKVDGLTNPIPKGRKLCECEDTKQEVCCKDDYSDCECEIPEINEFPSSETTISALGSPENRTKTFRGSPYQDKHNRDYVNFLDEQERKSKKDYHNIKDSEPLEENDPNIHEK